MTGLWLPPVPPPGAVLARRVAADLVKRAAGPDAPALSPTLTGTLYASRSGWVLLSVPNALGRGLFDALGEPGVELPRNSSGLYNAHVSVFRPEELAAIGGPDVVTERGHQFRYNLGPVLTVKPDGWAGVDRVWFASVVSPELQALRRSYGLSGLPDNGRKRFHVTFAVRRRGVLGRTDTAKAAAAADDPGWAPPAWLDDVRWAKRAAEPTGRQAAAAALAALTEEERDGLYVYHHAGPPELLLVDVMDWGDAKAGRRVADAFKGAVKGGIDPGRDAQVLWQNEGAKPGKGWEKLAAEAARPFTVGVDFDGTLAEAADGPFDPEKCGGPRKRWIALVNALHADGARVIVHTCRGELGPVKAWLAEHGVRYHHLNENPDQPPGSSTKLFADLYLDDRAVSALDFDRAKLDIARLKDLWEAKG